MSLRSLKYLPFRTAETLLKTMEGESDLHCPFSLVHSTISLLRPLWLRAAMPSNEADISKMEILSPVKFKPHPVFNGASKNLALFLMGLCFDHRAYCCTMVAQSQDTWCLSLLIIHVGPTTAAGWVGWLFGCLMLNWNLHLHGIQVLHLKEHLQSVGIKMHYFPNI